MEKRHKIFILILILTSFVLYLVLINGKPKYIRVTDKDVKEIILNETNYEIVDIRDKDVYNKGHIPMAILIPYRDFNENIVNVLPNKDAFIIIYGDDEAKTEEISRYLLKCGYVYVYDLGSINNWNYKIDTK